jgi:thiamine biosynthesis lipoprotein
MNAVTQARVESGAWRGLGTNVVLLVHDGGIDAARSAVEAVLDTVDRTYSSFRSDSELVAANARAGTTVEVSALLADAIAGALRAARLTDGLCDPTLGVALHRLGFVREAPWGDDSAPIIATIKRRAGWRLVDLDAGGRTVRWPAGVALDLGATGKALATELAAAAASRASGAAGVLVSLGGDLSIAGRGPRGGWRVLATDDSATPPDSEGEVVALAAGAMATSSTTVRRWRRGDVVVHHLIDPRTGLPARSPWRTVAVIAGTCVDANAASTAALILGHEGPGWIEAHGLAARFVAEDGLVLRAGAWPAPRSAVA